MNARKPEHSATADGTNMARVVLLGIVVLILAIGVVALIAQG